MIKEQNNGQDDLNEREFELINIIGAKIGANQRDLSRLMEMSLGMTNMLIRRLIEKGHIRINQLNKRKVEYILTPKGIAEKTRKTVMYTLKTINSIGLVHKRIEHVIKQHFDKGERAFYVLGGSDLATLIELALRDNKWRGCNVKRINSVPQERCDGIILICRENVSPNGNNKERCIDMIEELSKDYDLISNGKT